MQTLERRKLDLGYAPAPKRRGPVNLLFAIIAAGVAVGIIHKYHAAGTLFVFGLAGVAGTLLFASNVKRASGGRLLFLGWLTAALALSGSFLVSGAAQAFSKPVFAELTVVELRRTITAAGVFAGLRVLTFIGGRRRRRRRTSRLRIN